MNISTRNRYQRRGRKLGFALLALAMVQTNGIDSARARTGQVISLESQTLPNLTATQTAARAHLDRFFHLVLDDDGVARMGAAVRISRIGSDGRSILIWVAPFAEQDGKYYGRVGGSPRKTNGITPGDLVTFDRSQVVDWSFFGADGRMYGNYSTRLMLHTLNPGQAAGIAATLSSRPAPAEWIR